VIVFVVFLGIGAEITALMASASYAAIALPSAVQ
jgi:hypothetical protein